MWTPAANRSFISSSPDHIYMVLGSDNGERSSEREKRKANEFFVSELIEDAIASDVAQAHTLDHFFFKKSQCAECWMKKEKARTYLRYARELQLKEMEEKSIHERQRSMKSVH
jgi:hypothetical protein